MTHRLRALLVEDSESDALLLALELERAGITLDFERVDTAPTLAAALDRETAWQIVLSDYHMPGFGGLAALAMVREKLPEIPFIIVSGTIGEDIAVQAMKAGAHDYVMKSNLARLAPAIRREMREAAVRREARLAAEALRESERRFSAMLANVELMSLMLDGEARVTYVNDHLLRSTGWTRQEVLGQDWFARFVPSEEQRARAVFARLIADTPGVWHVEHELLTKQGARRMVRWNNSVLRSPDGQVIGTASIGEDVTERRRAEIRIRRLNRVYAVLSGINALIVHASNRGELFQEACRIAVDTGQLLEAMISVFAPEAVTGHVVTWSASRRAADPATDATGQGPVSRQREAALRHCGPLEPAVCNDVATDPQVEASRAALLDRGVRSLACLRLALGEHEVAIFSLAADEPGFFDDEEIRLLQQLAIRRVAVRLAIVSQGNTHHATVPDLAEPGHRKDSPIIRRLPRGQHERRNPGIVPDVMVQLVTHFEGCRQPCGHRGLHVRQHRDLELAVPVMAPRAAAHEIAVVLRPIAPVVPQRGMDQQETLAGLHMPKHSLT